MAGNFSSGLYDIEGAVMSYSVLLVEDNKEILENMKEILELANYTVKFAANGKEGLEILQKTPVDIILCDVTMPELDGYAMLRGVSNNPKTKHIPFIFVTARAEKKDIRKGMDMGADDYLTKPFSGSELLSLISTRLRKAGELREVPRVESRESGDLFREKAGISNIFSISDKILPKKFRKREVLYSEGEHGNHIYYILSGKIKAYRTNEQGKEYITQIYKEKEFLGYSMLQEAGLYEETAVAIEDTETASVSRRDFQFLLANNEDLHAQFLNFLTHDLSESNDKLIRLAYNSARKRVSEAVLFIGGKYFKALTDGATFPVSREDISSISGVSPESVSRNLTDFRSERLLEHINGQIKILDVKKLADVKN